MAASVKILFAETIGTNPPTPFTKGGSYGVSSDSVDFNLIGQNPAQADALSVLCRDNAPFVSAGLGFTTNFLAAVAYQENRFAQFTSIQQCSPSPLIPLTDGYPVQACDNGYGIMQLTQGIPGGLIYNLNRYTGTPTQTMIWNWVANINAGENVMLNKFSQETAYEKRMVNQQGADYPTPEQQEMNVWQRYNGGLYWVWSLCATQVNGVCTAGWERNDAFCNNPNKPAYQDLTCQDAFPQ